MTTRNVSRREFIKTTAASGALAGGALAGGGYWSSVEAAESSSPNEVIRFGCIGVGGKGDSDSRDASNEGDIVAICDVDDNTLHKRSANEKFAKAQQFNDFRKMIDEVGKSLDAVTVSTPDHNHAAAAALAMRAGLACFVQKPLTHTIYEARRLGEIAREMKVATQMGNQGTAGNGLREGAAVVQSGALGTVKEVHVWTNRPVWPQGGERPAEAPVPPHLHWDLWLGTAAARPYGAGYHPFAWRGWWDFGTGALGDMACHTFNLPFMALGLRDPVSVVAESSGHNQESYPKWSMITFEFPANEKRPGVKVMWYDGGKRPDPSLLDDGVPEVLEKDEKGNDKPSKKPKMKASGMAIVGEKGKLYSPDDYGGAFTLIGCEKPADVEYTKSPGHFKEFAQAVKGGPPAMSNFPNYAGPLTETILLGNLAVWATGKKLEWDSKNLAATNAPEVAHIIKATYREGYSL
jgi:predicted dehydrogenase